MIEINIKIQPDDVAFISDKKEILVPTDYPLYNLDGTVAGVLYTKEVQQNGGYVVTINDSEISLKELNENWKKFYPGSRSAFGVSHIYVTRFLTISSDFYLTKQAEQFMAKVSEFLARTFGMEM